MVWNGFECIEFEFEGCNARVILPKKPIIKSAVAVKTVYFNAFPETEIMLVEQGMLLCCVDPESRWGKESDIDRLARFIKHVAEKFGTAEKCVPVGMSCGGLIAVQFAAKYPELVSCLYLDAPVMNFMSCPCGCGVGIRCDDDFPTILNDLGLESISELICSRDMPMDKIPVLIKNRIPVIMAAGDIDIIVPYRENGILLERAYSETDIDFELHIRPGCGHHPHGLNDPFPVVSFIMNHIP